MISSIAGRLLQVAAYTSINGELVYDFTGEQLDECSFSWNSHGELELNITSSMSYEEATGYLQPRPLLIYQVNDGANPIWIGRGNIPKWTDGKLSINALGLWIALDDIPYTAFWSTQMYGGWVPLSPLEEATSFPERFEMANDDRLYIAATAPSVQGAGRIGYMAYRVPDKSRRTITNIDYTYAFSGAVGWQAIIQTRDVNLGTATNVQTYNGLGALQTGTAALTFTGQPTILQLFRFNGVDTNYSGNAGADYFQLSNVRLRSTNTAVTTQFIAADILDAQRNRNPGFLSARTDRLTGPTVDHKEAVFEDARGTDVLLELAAKNATGTPPAPLEVGVWCGVLVTQARGTGSRTWYHDLLNIEVERASEDQYTAVIAKYTNSAGRTIRTAEAIDSRAAVKAGVIKIDIVDADTTDATNATAQRDMRLNDRKTGAVRFTIPETTVVYDGNGAPVPITEVRPGDILIAQQFQSYEQNDALRRIRIGMVSIDAIAGTVQMEAEEPIPTLETALAGQG